MDYNQIKQSIIDNITTNGKGSITGQVLQDILLEMLEKQEQNNLIYVYEGDIAYAGDSIVVDDSLLDAIDQGKIIFFIIDGTAVPALYRLGEYDDIYMTLTLPSEIKVTDPDASSPNIEVRNSILVERIYYKQSDNVMVMEGAKYVSPTKYEQQ